MPHNTKKIQLAHRSKNNLTCNKQIILLMITDGEKWYYLVSKNKLESHKKICENHDYCHVENSLQKIIVL